MQLQPLKKLDEVWSHSLPKVFVIGYGNSLRSDDGVGVAVAEALAEQCRDNPDVRVVAAMQLTPDMSSDIAEARFVLFVDAAAGDVPGTIQRFPVSAADAGQLQTHYCTPPTLLSLAEQLYGGSPAATVLTVSAESFEPGTNLSPSVQARVPEVVALAKSIVAEWCRTSAAGDMR
jgi:hydrogenase maturation protease